MNYLDTIKSGFKDKEKRTQNLILLIVLLVILLIATNYIFKDSKSDENSQKKSQISNNTSYLNNINDIEDETKSVLASDVEEKLENILGMINGIDDVSVMLTFTSGAKQNIAYNTKETTKDGENSIEQSVAYNEEGSSKKAIVESVETPQVEGVIIVAKGASGVEIKQKIATAVAMAVNVPVYKIQIFEK